VRRALRIGAINYHVQWMVADTLLARLRFSAKMLLLIPFACIKAFRLLLTGQNTMMICHPIIVAAGSALASFGIEPQPYKAKT
jgi:hypothetical protein